MQKEFDCNNEKIAKYLAEVHRMLSLENPNVLILETRCFGFVVLLTKLDDSVSQTGLSSFGRLSICFSKF
jgi:hypothetical protein